MIKIVFGFVVFITAVSPWIYIAFSGGALGGKGELEDELQLRKQELIVERSKVEDLNHKVTELQDDVQTYRSKVEFLEESIVKTEGHLSDAVKERDSVDDQLKLLRNELTDVENRLLEETNRANTLDSTNEMIGFQLDKSIKEVKRLQSIIRTLSDK